MGSKKNTRIRKPLPAPKPLIEATAERLAQAGKDHVSLENSLIERGGDKVVLCRRFKDSWIDRQRKAGRLTYPQWYAAEWYRERYAEAGMSGKVVANYQASTGNGSGVTYGLPTTTRQVDARKLWRMARAQMPAQMLGLIDRVVIHDDAPAFRNGQQGGRFAATLAKALQPLAEWLMPSCAPVDAASISMIDVATVA